MVGPFTNIQKVKLEFSGDLLDSLDTEPSATALFDLNDPGYSVYAFLTACLGREPLDRATFDLTLVCRDGYPSQHVMIHKVGDHLRVHFTRDTRKDKDKFSLSFLLSKVFKDPAALQALTHIIVRIDPWRGEGSTVTAIKSGFWLAPQPELWSLDRETVQVTDRCFPDQSYLFFSGEVGLSFELIRRTDSDLSGFRVRDLHSEECGFPDGGAPSGSFLSLLGSGVPSLRDLLLDDDIYESWLDRRESGLVLAPGQPIPFALKEQYSELMSIDELSSTLQSEDLGIYETDFLLGLGLDPKTKFALEPRETIPEDVSKLWHDVYESRSKTTYAPVVDQESSDSGSSYGRRTNASIYTQWALLPPDVIVS